jgi:hypothetical protein
MDMKRVSQYDAPGACFLSSTRSGEFNALPILFISLAIIISVQCSLAQVRIGVHGGSRISSLSRPDYGAEWNWLGKPMAGVSADVEVSDHLLLVIGFEYLQKWTALNGAPWTMSSGTTYFTTLRSTYTELPMYLRWRLDHSSARWFCDLGASLSHMISTVHILTARGDVITVDLAEEFRTTDIASTMGGRCLSQGKKRTQHWHRHWGLVT